MRLRVFLTIAVLFVLSAGPAGAGNRFSVFGGLNVADQVGDMDAFGDMLASDLAVAQSSIRERLEPLGVGPDAVAPVQPSLEDVFVSMVLRSGGAPGE